MVLLNAVVESSLRLRSQTLSWALGWSKKGETERFPRGGDREVPLDLCATPGLAARCVPGREHGGSSQNASDQEGASSIRARSPEKMLNLVLNWRL